MGTRLLTTSQSQPLHPWLSQQAIEFKTEFHPHSNQPPLWLWSSSPFISCIHVHLTKHLWCVTLFCGVGDFEFMEIALEASLNQKQVDALLDLIGHVAKGAAWVTLKNDIEFHKACDAAAAELTLVC
ncbi:hypothetical protein BKA82DRAFT_132974 [Pisolithus tinctorius]|uniref:Uncharacterized protein n=1 Tax=Pisolithus tinctorius Marx 270 TaxID=870435 RepID=A0A0C3P672_PISTI|nr:hypothetical protein BKA82DRAFT_132974 [Pisolithus tinctorius]KIO08770.1 hypothetical protein M404DRAFT_132974 [Pisolithus tinctorius Marx 270]